MKVVLNEIEVVAWHKENNEVVPLQFRMDYKKTVKIEQIIEVTKKRRRELMLLFMNVRQEIEDILLNFFLQKVSGFYIRYDKEGI